MARWIVAVAVGVALSACAQIPRPEDVALTSPPGMALPVKGRLMVYISDQDLARKFSYNINPISKEETGISDGQALDRAARGVLGKAFAVVATNDPGIRPDVVARITGKAVWDRDDGSFKVTCELDAHRADGDAIGYFFSVIKSAPVMSFAEALPRVYAQCLKPPTEELMRSPAMAAMVRAGFPPLDPAAVRSYLRSQGFAMTGP
ncbi:MAG: hypothetical protein M0006_04995 [Magnetospirillum sp.]|nr:hypothetical protein [Magnetospirillum sp.]